MFARNPMALDTVSHTIVRAFTTDTSQPHIIMYQKGNIYIMVIYLITVSSIQYNRPLLKGPYNRKIHTEAPDGIMTLSGAGTRRGIMFVCVVCLSWAQRPQCGSVVFRTSHSVLREGSFNANRRLICMGCVLWLTHPWLSHLRLD